MTVQVLAVAVGAALGALLRWCVGLWLNPLWAGFPLGTLAVNCGGGLMAGIALFVFTQHPAEGWRLLTVTGFLGGLTTFSAFSAESLLLLLRGQWPMALLHGVLHVFGALACAAAGHALARQMLA